MKMNKLTKGAVALGVGTALMLGGAGTFAYWNQSVQAGGGTITAGNLELTAETGKWTGPDGQPIDDISKYRIVPGDKLTYTQDLNVTLEGSKIAANLTVERPAGEGNTFNPENIKIGDITLKKGAQDVDNLLTESQTVTASTTFEFKEDVTGNADVNATYDFDKVAFKLQQVKQPGLE